MSEIRNKVRAEMVKRMVAYWIGACEESQYEPLCQDMLDIADKILSIPELAVVDRKALPPAVNWQIYDKYEVAIQQKGQLLMVKAGWVKELKK